MMAMSQVAVHDAISCTSCEVEVVGRPVVHEGLPFCCAGCAAGGPCTCSYDRDRAAEPNLDDLNAAGVRYCLDIRAMVMAGPPVTEHGRGRMLTHE